MKKNTLFQRLFIACYLQYTRFRYSVNKNRTILYRFFFFRDFPCIRDFIQLYAPCTLKNIDTLHTLNHTTGP